MHSQPKTALTIAGFDPTSGAGVTADIKVFRRLGLFGMSVITAITAQNTKGVEEVMPVDSRFLKKQLYCLADDLRIDCIKIGMLYTLDVIKVVERFLKRLDSKTVVIDPIVASSSGKRLIQDDALKILIKGLLPIALTATPNIKEAEIITGIKIKNLKDMKDCAKSLITLGLPTVIITGGHFDEYSGKKYTLDLVYDGKRFLELRGMRLGGSYHGTGCAYSSALTAFLANGKDIFESAVKARQFVKRQIKNSISIGSGMRLLEP